MERILLLGGVERIFEVQRLIPLEVQMSAKAVTRLTVIAALASAALAGTAGAQGFVAMPGSFNNTPVTNPAPARPFFDNLSDDGAGCNIGFVLSNAAGVNNNCANQRPAGWLPFTGAAPGAYYGNGTNYSNYLFAAGTYTIDLLYAKAAGGSGLLGEIAGADTRFGIYNSVTNVQTTLSGIGALPYTFTSASAWGFFIDLVDGPLATAFSGLGAGGRQAALFLGAGSSAGAAGGVISPNVGTQTFYVGLEDKACTQLGTTGCTVLSDFDNNDAVLRVQTSVVPEPSTYLLMASGLLGLGFAARRRRSV